MTHHVPRVRHIAVAMAAAGLLVATTAACSMGPTTKEEVCDRYDSLGDRLGIGQVFGNPVFSAAGDLADVADRYEGPEDLSTDAQRLESIADSDSTSELELSEATRNVAVLCGHQLGSGSFSPPG
ncbi:molybdenum ABC transporter substrate-binding protein [Streptomyces albogriseolus]|uniref:molybdenum ABC transporter substrate-binding protein n=1 Tax=Streptomyces albogriseolus TaxID=1887 RepID=UPI00345F8158